MKKTNKIMSLVMVLILLMSMFSCGKKTNDPESEIPLEELEYKLEKPSKELQEKFRKEYIAFQGYGPNDYEVYIKTWYGSFGDIAFLSIRDGGIGYQDFPRYYTKTVAGHVFTYSKAVNIIRVWVDSKFLDMDDAYEQNLITENMVARIAKAHKNKEGIIINEL